MTLPLLFPAIIEMNKPIRGYTGTIFNYLKKLLTNQSLLLYNEIVEYKTIYLPKTIGALLSVNA